jgi:hypothetical protein
MLGNESVLNAASIQSTFIIRDIALWQAHQLRVRRSTFERTRAGRPRSAAQAAGELTVSRQEMAATNRLVQKSGSYCAD